MIVLLTHILYDLLWNVTYAYSQVFQVGGNCSKVIFLTYSTAHFASSVDMRLLKMDFSFASLALGVEVCPS